MHLHPFSGSFPLVQGAEDNIAVGVYPGGKAVWEYESELGVKFNHVLQFQSVKQLNYAQIVPFLDRGYDIILNIEFQDSFANLKQIAAGYYDSYLIALAKAIKNDGRTIWLRPLHEFNGDWYNWGTLYIGNTIADFIPAWRHVVQVFRDQGAPVKFQLNYNRSNGKDNPTAFSAFYPGDEWVDMVLVTCYNRAGTDQWSPPSSWREFRDVFKTPYDKICALTSKPIGLAETSSTTYGGDKVQWILNAFKAFANDFPRLSQVTWLLKNKTVNGILRNWDLNSEAEKDAFTRGMAVLRGSYSLIVHVTGSGTTSIKRGAYSEGTSVQVSATPSSGWVFDHWTLNTNAAGSATTYVVTMNNNNNLTATFTKIPSAYLFEDSFESGSFSAWSGTGVTTGETRSVSSRYHHGSRSATFYSNGGGGTERAYVYKSIAATQNLYARGYFYVSTSGVKDVSDRFQLIAFRAGSTSVAYAGWYRTSSGLRWFLSISGSSAVTAYSSTAPSLGQWYSVELNWHKGTSDGSGTLWVNGVKVASLTNRNTGYYGNVASVRFGLAELYGCSSTRVYVDCVRIGNSYIGLE